MCRSDKYKIDRSASVKNGKENEALAPKYYTKLVSGMI